MHKFSTVVQQLQSKEARERVFKPLQVEVNSSDDFWGKIKLFNSLVQKERVLALYKEKQAYEKPSMRKRRKKREAVEKRLAAEARQRLIESGEWEKRQKDKQKKKDEKSQRRVEEKKYD